MSNKRFVLNKELELAKDTVINEVSKVVCDTMGPNGGYSIINEGFMPYFTKDGVTVANKVAYLDTFMQSICRTFIEPSIESDKEIGDGTTTSIFFTAVFYFLFKEELKKYAKCEEIKNIVNDMIKHVEDNTIYIDDINDPFLYKTALTTSNGDVEITNNILNIFKDCNQYSIENVKIEHGVDYDVIDVYNDLVFPNMKCLIKQDLVLNVHNTFVIGGNISKFDENYQLYKENLYKLNLKSIEEGSQLVLICNSFDDDFLNYIDHINLANKKLVIIPCTIPCTGITAKVLLEDIKMVVDGKSIPDLSVDYSKELEWPSLVKLHLFEDKCYVKEDDITDAHRIILNERLDEIITYYNELDRSMKTGYTGIITRRRICMLLGEVINIKVGGETPSDIEERKARYIDVLGSIKNSLNGGVIPGIGSVLINYFKDLDHPHHKDLLLINKLSALCYSQYTYLNRHDNDSINDIKSLLDYLLEVSFSNIKNPVYVDLSTGKKSDNINDLDVYDVSKSLIFALRKGLSTAINLAKCTSVLSLK